MALDFRRGAELFMGSERELAAALGMSEEELRGLRRDPSKASEALLVRLGHVLVERGRAMVRVGELFGE